ncbi:hypothetical protein MT349_18955 [Rathayibacter caricis]|uniref:hypothetical protein n=1 Tax=Rathayibacter caricis TaxID=110936 RepID=UPI001FB36FE0|nr:hypothetical protein [Rathayibacter caricis]MCJ1697867.1 hypothetical protein [Rathayibacter caricis]
MNDRWHSVYYLDRRAVLSESGRVRDRCEDQSSVRDVEAGDVFAEVDRDALAERRSNPRDALLATAEHSDLVAETVEVDRARLPRVIGSDPRRSAIGKAGTDQELDTGGERV